MLRTPLCDLLGIDVPVIGAPFGPWEQVELAAAMCEAGALGSVGTAVRPARELRDQWTRLRGLTDRPFAINHTARPLDEEAFAATLEFGPPIVSFHLAVPGDLIARAHDAGILWLQQVVDVRQAEQAVEAGADVIIAQGGEAGGNGGFVSTMVLVPQVIDIAGKIPVVAAGGIADGRGLAAALALGAQGACLGTRFLACTEMTIANEWKQRIVAADALDAVKVTNSEQIMPPFTLPTRPAAPRCLRTPLIDQLRDDPAQVDSAEYGPKLVHAILDGRGHEYLPFTGQSAGLIHDIAPAAVILDRLIAEADTALRTATAGRVPA
jgi:enoyl-[acyl-carrier protein] reductase II